MEKPDLMKSLGLVLSHKNRLNEVIAKNISKANIPRAKAETIEPLTFKQRLVKKDSVNLSMTNTNHIQGKYRPPIFKAIVDKNASEITPAGNNIVLSEQLEEASTNNIKVQEYLKVYMKFKAMQEEVLE